MLGCLPSACMKAHPEHTHTETHRERKGREGKATSHTQNQHTHLLFPFRHLAGGVS